MIKKTNKLTFSIEHVLIFLLSIAIAVSAIYLIGSFSKDPEFVYGMIAIAFIPPAGKESVIPAMVFRGIEAPIIFSIIVFSDIAACFIVLSSFEIVNYIAGRVKFLEKLLNKSKKKSEFARKHGLLHVGLGAFMFIPFQGTGSIATSFLAQIFGVKKWRTVLIVLIGSTASTIFFLGISLGLFELI
ncbi:MAG: small multi-drug export protein [archaeon]